MNVVAQSLRYLREQAGLDVELSAFMTSASTLIAIVATPLAYVLLR